MREAWNEPWHMVLLLLHIFASLLLYYVSISTGFCAW